MDYLRLVPEQASTIAPQIDVLIAVYTILSVFFTFAIALAIICFTIIFHKSRYVNREESDEIREMVHGKHMAIEITWTVIPTIMALFLFVWSSYVYYEATEVPDKAMEVNVIAKRWMWKMQHPSGRREVNTLHIPKDQPIKLTMISQDVIHDFFVPAFRVKRDVIPGRYTQLWFEPNKVGEYMFYCNEYCGTEHSRMIGKVHVMEPDDYERWLNDGNIRLARASSPEAAGERLFTTLGCAGCHAAGSSQRGPALHGKFGKEEKIEGGSTITVDEEYIRESILNPTAKVVLGYPKLMPTYKGQVREEDIANIIAYIKSLQSAES